MKSRFGKEGFTLIELMVVIILVMILALALVPTFKEVLVKAKYTEGAAAISALRTKIKVAWLEDSRLPGLPATFTDSSTTVGGCSWGTYTTGIDEYDASGALTDGGAYAGVQRMCSREGETNWLIEVGDSLNHDNPLAFVNHPSITSVDKSPWQDDLNISIGDYAGAYYKNQDYQYLAMNGGVRVSGYAYAIAVCGSAQQKSAPIGTAYAVLEIYNPDGWQESKRLTATYQRYAEETPLNNNTASQMYLCPYNDATVDYTTFGNQIAVPNWHCIVSNLTLAAATPLGTRPDTETLNSNFGFDAQ